jgi:hypothetical protein
VKGFSAMDAIHQRIKDKKGVKVEPKTIKKEVTIKR